MRLRLSGLGFRVAHLGDVDASRADGDDVGVVGNGGRGNIHHHLAHQTAGPKGHTRGERH